MIKKNPLFRQLTLAVTLITLILAANAWAVESGQNQKKKKKNKNKSPSVNQVLKKVDRQILSYSPEKARELIGEVEDKNDPDIEAAMGRILILEKDYDQAANKLLAASKRSDDPFVLVDLGDAYAYAKSQGNAQSSYQQAAQKAQAALAESPDDSNARFTLGVAQQRLKQYDQAAENLDRARIADPRNERIAFELGLTQMLLGDNQGGFDQLTKAVDLYSGYAYAYYYRALAADKIDRKDITVNDLDRFLRLAPEAPEAEKARRILQAARG
ncbi:MAG: tetratricopeptide repeat protein [Acidobacteriota bacterium]